MTTAIPTIAVFPDEKLTLDQKIEKWVWYLCRSLEDNYDKQYPHDPHPNIVYNPVRFRMQSGRKYWKIIQTSNQGDNGVHAFVNKKTGEVYKPASYKSPAAIVRYDLRLISDRQKLHDPNYTNWAGGYLYLR